MTSQRTVLKDPEQVAQQAADQCLQLARDSVERQGAFYIALAGGSTPKKLYTLLAQPPYRDQMPWQQVHVFFGDERSVPPDHADSNYRMARESLLDHVPIPPDRIHPMYPELKHIRLEAYRYQELIRRLLPRHPSGEPRFDLIWLGMGDDGHTASLFPNTCLLHEFQLWVGANYVPQLNTWRMSLTYPVINAARVVSLLVTGQNKNARLGEIFGGAGKHYPVEKVAGRDQTVWFLDEAAAAELPPP